MRTPCNEAAGGGMNMARSGLIGLLRQLRGLGLFFLSIDCQPEAGRDHVSVHRVPHIGFSLETALLGRWCRGPCGGYRL